MAKLKRILGGLLCLAVAAAIWIPAVHLFFPVDARGLMNDPGVSPTARALAARHLALWSDPEARRRELGDLRRSNAEWDFMGRTYLVLSLANMSLRDPSMKPQALTIIDHILEETLRLESAHGFYHFSMDYAKNRPYIDQPPRSQFVDGEIALMLGARRLIEEKGIWRGPFEDRIRTIEERMERSPSLSTESYPDECWTFDNVNALAAMRMADALDGGTRRTFCAQWVARAKEKLVEPKTGLLVSEFTRLGSALDGPEGSSIWMVAHALQLIDEPFARDQYERARRYLRRPICGFDVAREWPVELRGAADIDSGMVIPFIDASPGSSGLALLGARAFDDAEFYGGLLRSLDLAAFPVRRKGTLRYQASNQVGDAVLLYSTVLGPLWSEVKRRAGP